MLNLFLIRKSSVWLICLWLFDGFGVLQAQTNTNSAARLARRRFTLAEAYKDSIKAPEGSPEKRKLLEEVFEVSRELLLFNQDQLDVWVVRADAALSTEESQVGWEAGKHLLRLGAEESQDEIIQKLLARLERKKWLGRSPPPDSRLEAAKWEGTWGVSSVSHNPHHPHEEGSWKQWISQCHMSSSYTLNIMHTNGAPVISKIKLATTWSHRTRNTAGDRNKHNEEWSAEAPGSWKKRYRHEYLEQLDKDERTEGQYCEQLRCELAFEGHGLLAKLIGGDYPAQIGFILDPLDRNRLLIIQPEAIQTGTFDPGKMPRPEQLRSLRAHSLPTTPDGHIRINFLTRIVQPESRQQVPLVEAVNVANTHAAADQVAARFLQAEKEFHEQQHREAENIRQQRSNLLAEFVGKEYRYSEKTSGSGQRRGRRHYYFSYVTTALTCPELGKFRFQSTFQTEWLGEEPTDPTVGEPVVYEPAHFDTNKRWLVLRGTGLSKDVWMLIQIQNQNSMLVSDGECEVRLDGSWNFNTKKTRDFKRR